jgi:hypothetical protein
MDKKQAVLKIAYFLFMLLFCFTSLAQNRNSIWCFGDSAGINFSDTTNPIAFTSSLDTRGTCVSICDSLGNLMFYANTRASVSDHSTLVWNSNHQIMQNGGSIEGSGWYNELCIIPMPGSNSRYYLFSAGVTGSPGFYYSIIDLSFNNGLGKVVQKNIPLSSLRNWDAQSAIRHANGRDWWHITKEYATGGGTGNSLFHVRLITPIGIRDSLQSLGLIEFGNGGNLTFSKLGDRLLFSSYNGFVEVMDFDRCTGILSNPIVVYNSLNNPHISGSAFSPDGNMVYLSTSNGNSYLVQFDLTAPNIPNSVDTIASIVLPFEAGGSLRLAPDNKIYWACAWTNGINFNYPYADTMYHYENMNMSVINQPNVRGVGCDLSLYGFNLGGKRVYWGLPNNPDYSMGSIPGSPCDSLTNSVDDLISRSDLIQIYPSPFTKSISLHFDHAEKRRIEIYSTNGQLVNSTTLFSAGEDISLQELSAGIYLLKIIGEDSVIAKRVEKLE